MENKETNNDHGGMSDHGMAGTIWDIVDLDYEITERHKGPSIESFKSDYKDYVDAIKSLRQYSESAIRTEIENWDLTISEESLFDFQLAQSYYAKLISYRIRITYLQDIVNQHYELLSESVKSLKTMAVKLSTGAKHDKEATATNIIQPLAKALANATRFKASLDGVYRNIDFVSWQMEKLLREKQSISRINNEHVREGMSHSYTSLNEERESPENNSQFTQFSGGKKTKTVVKTRSKSS
jgi:hypothetical protein